MVTAIYETCLERSSARETTMRVAVGAVAKKFLEEIGIRTVAHVHEIGGVKIDPSSYENLSMEELREVIEQDPVYCADPDSFNQDGSSNR